MLYSAQASTDKQAGRRFNSIDVLKLIMAFAVVAIHTQPLEACSNSNLLNAYDLLVNMAVPFFFLSSGYLLAVKMHWPYGNAGDLARIRTQLKKITWLYILCSIVYLPLAIHPFILHRMSPSQAIVQYIKGFFLRGEQYNSWHLWYLLSTIYALLLIWAVLKIWRTPKSLIYISIMAGICSIGITTLAQSTHNLSPAFALLQRIIQSSICNSRLLRGMVYIPIGMLLAHKQIPAVWNWVGLVIGYTANFFVSDEIMSSYLLMITSIALFGIIEKIDLKNNSIYGHFRNMSTIIYLIHMYIWSFYYKIVYGEKTFGIDSFLVTSIVSTIISFIVVYIIGMRKRRK